MHIMHVGSQKVPLFVEVPSTGRYLALRVGPFGKNDDNGDPTKLTSRGWDLQSTSQRGLGFCRRIL